MGSIALLIVYTIILGLLELQFHFTVGQVVERLIRFLVGSG
jgi:hypothetical protein